MGVCEGLMDFKKINLSSAQAEHLESLRLTVLPPERIIHPDLATTLAHCPECDGRGQYLDAPSHDGRPYWQTCEVCGGTGFVASVRD